MSFEGENERDGEVEDGMAEEEWECVRSRCPGLGWAGLLWVCVGGGKYLPCLALPSTPCHAMPCHAYLGQARAGSQRWDWIRLDGWIMVWLVWLVWEARQAEG
jgi:hypothetical protein